MTFSSRIAPWAARVQTLVALIHRHPNLMALAAFISGALSFALVDRQIRLAKVVAVLMLVSWLWLLAENLLRERLQRWFGWTMPEALLRFLTQSIHQESLFFVLPFFFLTTSWNTPQALFTGFLCACALLTIIDPLYNKQLVPRRWLYLIFHSLTLFVLLLTTLPIVWHLPTAQSYQWALAVAAALSLISLLAQLRERSWRGRLALFALTLSLAGAGWVGRSLVPPASLWLTDMALSSSKQGREAGKRLIRISEAKLRSNGLYAFTAINAPRGLDERIFHVWLRDGQEIERIPLNIHGGREAGYRAWTRKRNFPATVQGHWQVRVVTEGGQLLGILRFEVNA